MPWSKYMKDESHPKVYLELIDALLEHTSSDKNFMMRDLYIRSEIMKFDFTKRQRSIITFIFGMSYNYGKEKAVIPRMRDWEICGVQQSKAPMELQKLLDMEIITWNKETNEFGIADPRDWKAPINQGYNRQRARELFIINLKHAGIDVESIIKKSLDKGGNFLN